MTRIAVLLLTVALVGVFALPTAAHTPGHGHTCLSSAHGWQTDGWPNRHNAVVTLTPHPDGFMRKVTVNHQTNIGGVWTSHTGSVYSCLVA